MKQPHSVLQLRYYLFLSAVLTFCLILIFSAVKKPAALPSIADIVALQHSEASAQLAYTVEIEESGPGYSLSFSGQVHEGQLYGNLEKYNLQIFATDDSYYVRGAEMFKQWQPLEKAELEGLSAFVREPLALLGLLLQSGISHEEKGPDREINGVPCHAYLLEIAPAYTQDLSLISASEDMSVERMRVYLWFGENDNFLYQMALVFDIGQGNEKGQISRIYSMSLQEIEMPPDLPQDEELEI